MRLRSRSPPSRAAWIEMSYDGVEHEVTVSPPSRAAWIEIVAYVLFVNGNTVAAFTGGVD